MIRSFFNMPLMLRFITAHAILCFAFFIAVLIPGIPFQIDGKVVSKNEVWASGIGASVVILGLLMPTTGILLLKRWRYSRELYSTILGVTLILPYAIWSDLIGMVFGIVMTIVISCYLFINKNVRAYLAS